MPFIRLFSLFLVFFTAACSEAPEGDEPFAPGPQPEDRFSYANNIEVVVRHVELDLAVDFGKRVLTGTAELTFEVLDEEATTLVLDTRGLEIATVNANGTALDYTLDPEDPLLGAKLTIRLPKGTDKVTIAYQTSPEASGLQWLSPEQTAGGDHPFLFSQSQAIHARSWVPLQDTPAVRITYKARLKTPPGLVALMSSSQDPDGAKDGDYRFEMPQPIPSYLMAIAVGDLEFRPISGTIGVYAESYIVDAAAEEFADTPLMEAANAKLYGPYRWGRYDLLVLPPSFPFGGMENPRLSFLTPTLIAGDKSLTNVVAHELAHSWSGNLVTNSTWRDSWINEGITSYVENRVIEELYGPDRAEMEQVLAKDDWRRDMEAAEDPALTALALPDHLENPDDAFTNIAYVKGQFFLNFLEDRFGREVFDPFLKGFFDTFAFKSISSADFRAYLEANLIGPNPGRVTGAEIDEWLYGQGMPETTRAVASDAFGKVAAPQAAFLSGEVSADAIPTAGWTTHEWLYFLNTLPGDLTLEQFSALDEAFGLSNSANAEIAFAWFMKTIPAGYKPAVEPLRAFLMRVGRGKFIYRLYQSLVDSGQKDWALEVFEAARTGYHPIAQNRIDAIFAEE